MSECPKAKLAQVRVENQVPEDLHQAMLAFVAQHPQWPQPRLLQVAVACCLVQDGGKNPAVVERDLAGMFQQPSQEPAAPPPSDRAFDLGQGGAITDEDPQGFAALGVLGFQLADAQPPGGGAFCLNHC